MKKVTVNLENCYGIRKLNHVFDFTKGNSFAIYAPNGSMKTSFAKTFQDLSLGNDSKDEVFPERKTVRTITADSSAIKSENVFVVEPYSESFTSQRASTLLVNKKLREEYEKIWADIESEQETLLKELRKVSGVKKAEQEIAEVLANDPDNFIDAMKRAEPIVKDGKEPVHSSVKYSTLFNNNVLKALSDKQVQSELKGYIERYDELIEKSRFFRKGVFNHTNAETIAKALVSNGFFEASHSVNLSDENDSKLSQISSEKELEQVISKELEQILQDKTLLETFSKIDDKLKKNKELKSFRDYLALNKELLPELNNVNRFKDKIWIDYLKSCEPLYTNLMKKYKESDKTLKDIQEKANLERTKWAAVVDTFNKRFNVPFVLSVENKSDVILKNIVPVLGFKFKDEGGSKDLGSDDEKVLSRVLSNGERKALYILHILFEIEARKNLGIETLMIVDDLADSFDYKNKYAIIEYLKDMSEVDGFKQIVLTHNFDFYRTIMSRYVKYGGCLMIERKNDSIKLISPDYINNPFRDFVIHSDNQLKFLALVPFARNLVEYTVGDEDDRFNKLTSALHIKKDSASITKQHVLSLFNEIFLEEVKSTEDLDKSIIELFKDSANKLMSESGSFMLEGKIVISIAIRLVAEEFLVKALDESFVDKITKNQTAVLVDEYIKVNSSNEAEIEILKRVNLITPQNIHINSFMYEPILDMSDNELQSLYEEVKTLK